MKSAFYKKKSALREEILKMDWSKDGMLVLPGGRGYPYLSTDKIKKNLASAYPKCGLEFKASDVSITQMEGIGNMSQHWVVQCEYSLIDVDTGYTDTSLSYGEAADSGDKGIGKAKSHSFKRWAVAEFNLADGIDPDGTPVGESKFKPMSAEEEAKVMEKVQAKAVKAPAPKAPAPNPAPVPTPAPEKEAVAAPAEENTLSPGELALAKLKAEKDAQNKYVPSAPQKAAIDRIVNALTEKAKAGEMSNEDYNRMSMTCAEIDSGQKATEFIMKYKGMI